MRLLYLVSLPRPYSVPTASLQCPYTVPMVFLQFPYTTYTIPTASNLYAMELND